MSNWHRTARRGAVWLAAVLSVGGAWVGLTVGSWPRLDEPAPGTPELVVALSSGLDQDSALDPAGEGRLRTAAGLASQRHIPRLVTTRIADEAGTTSDYGQRVVIGGTKFAGPWTILAPVVQSTRDEALALAAELPGRRTVVVVTSRLHTRRACAAFERVGFTVECVNGYDPRSWRVPTEYLYERLAVVKYRRNDWMR